MGESTAAIGRVLRDDPDVVLALADTLGVPAFLSGRLDPDSAAAGSLPTTSWRTNERLATLIGPVASFEEFFRHIDPTDRDALIEAIASCADSNTTTGSGFRCRSSLGSQVELTVDLMPIGDDDLGLCIGTVTEQDTSGVTSLAETANRLKDLVGSVPGAVFRYLIAADGSDRIEYMSAGCFDIWEIEAAELQQDPTALWEQIHPDDLPAMRQSVHESAATLSEWHHEYRITTPSGRTKWLQASGMPRRLDDGSVLWHSIVTDVSRQQAAEVAAAAALRSTIDVLAATVETRDPYTAGHQVRVAEMAGAIGRELGLDELRLEGLELAASIHDIGKIQIPSEILVKPTQLTHLEYELIKSHSEVGASLLRKVDFVWPIAEMIEQHHERLDGSGYPHGLRGDEIMLEARIIAVADTIEAMSSHRPYRASLGMDAAIDEVTRLAGTTLDAEVVGAARTLVERGEIV